MFLNHVTCHSSSFRKTPKRRNLPLRPAAYVQNVEKVFVCIPITRTSKPITCALPSETHSKCLYTKYRYFDGIRAIVV